MTIDDENGVGEEAFRIIRSNIERRLDALEVTPYLVSISSGHYPSWLSNSMAKTNRISIARVAEIAEALGLELAEICDPDCPMDVTAPPAWYYEKDQ